MVNDEENGIVGKVIGAVFGVTLFILLLSVLFGSWYTVHEGDVGVMFHSFGSQQGFEYRAIQQGWGFKMPFRDKVMSIPFRTQTIGFYGATEEKGTYGSIQPKDKNGITYDVDLTIRYHLDATQAAAFIEQKGEGIAAMEAILSTAARADSTRGVFGQYAQEDVPMMRMELANEVKDVLQKRIDAEASGNLKPGFIVVEATDIRNVRFNTQIEDAIITKQTQKQVAERKTYELQTAEMERNISIVQADKDRQVLILQAEGVKQSTILKADGDAEATRKVAYAKADGTRAMADAYMAMSPLYVASLYANSIQPTDKIIFGLDSLSSNTLNFMDLNKLMVQKLANITG
jgi:regulator of protease activity HflC (stomatin/prohibitin superfamily)